MSDVERAGDISENELRERIDLSGTVVKLLGIRYYLDRNHSIIDGRRTYLDLRIEKRIHYLVS